MLDDVRVLVVEDHEAVAAFYAFVLERQGAIVTAALTVRGALEAFFRLKPDVLVIERTLPDGDGFEVIRAIRAEGPERGGDVPALVLSGRASEGERSTLHSGLQEFRLKPCSSRDLVAAIVRLAGRCGMPNRGRR